MNTTSVPLATALTTSRAKDAKASPSRGMPDGLSTQLRRGSRLPHRSVSRCLREVEAFGAEVLESEPAAVEMADDVERVAG